MKAHVFVIYEAIVYLSVTLPIVLIVSIICTFLVFKNIGFFVFLVLYLFAVVESFLINIISKYGMSRKAGIGFRFIFMTISVLVGVL